MVWFSLLVLVMAFGDGFALVLLWFGSVYAVIGMVCVFLSIVRYLLRDDTTAYSIV